MLKLVTGVAVFHPPDATGAYEQLRDAAPLTIPVEHDGIHVEVMNWEAIADAVHPKAQQPPPVPSPFPHLPATPQELLKAYLDVVGIRPSDCYSAQATVDRPTQLVEPAWSPPKQPCADGKARDRQRACECVVVAYRDTPEYAEGRARWSAYTAEVLQAELSHGLEIRPAIHGYEAQGLPSFLAKAELVDDAIDHFGAELPPLHRYCWVKGHAGHL
jgi:hypothetical protein